MTKLTYSPGFICDSCGYSAKKQSEIEKHVAIPVTGLELKTGDVLEIGNVDPIMGGRFDNGGEFQFPFLVVAGGLRINQDHFREYQFYTFCIFQRYNFNPIAKATRDPILHFLKDQKLLQESLITLPEKDFALLKKARIKIGPNQNRILLINQLRRDEDLKNIRFNRKILTK